MFRIIDVRISVPTLRTAKIKRIGIPRFRIVATLVGSEITIVDGAKDFCPIIKDEPEVSIQTRKKGLDWNLQELKGDKENLIKNYNIIHVFKLSSYSYYF